MYSRTAFTASPARKYASASFARASPNLGSCWTAFRYSMTASLYCFFATYASPLRTYSRLATSGSFEQAMVKAAMAAVSSSNVRSDRFAFIRLDPRKKKRLAPFSANRDEGPFLGDGNRNPRCCLADTAFPHPTAGARREAHQPSAKEQQRGGFRNESAGLRVRRNRGVHGRRELAERQVKNLTAGQRIRTCTTVEGDIGRHRRARGGQTGAWDTWWRNRCGRPSWNNEVISGTAPSLEIENVGSCRLPERPGVRRRQEEARTDRLCELAATEINCQVINP